MRQSVDTLYDAAGAECMTDPQAALLAYGTVLADPEQRDAFAKRWFTPGHKGADRAWKLLAMQEQALAAYASCAWFFDDIARIEPENALTFALRATDYMRDCGGPDITPQILPILEKAVSNQPSEGTGKDVCQHNVLPRRDDAATICLASLISHDPGADADKGDGSFMYFWPNVSVEMASEGSPDSSGETLAGRAVIRYSHEQDGTTWQWRWRPPTAEKAPGQVFVPLRESSLEARLVPRSKGTVDVGERRREVSKLSRPMRDYLLATWLKNRESRQRAELRASAAHSLSMLGPWLEAQSDVPRPEYWSGFIPYMVLEAMLNANIGEAQCERLKTLFELHLAARPRALARTLVEECLLDALPLPDDEAHREKGLLPDAVLAGAVNRAKMLLPDMDWWGVCNRVWDLGLKNYPELAVALGYKVE
jgi:hypothetical protein